MICSLYMDKIQMGLWPTVLGLAGFFWRGVRRTNPSYIMQNPNLSKEDKLAARQLTRTLAQRKLPLLAMLSLALLPFPGVETTTAGALAGAATGLFLGSMWTRSPHLMIINAIVAAAGLSYVALSPTWTLKYQSFRFARAWEDGEFIRAREWLNLFASTAHRTNKEAQQWTTLSLALAEMACGRTSAALEYANSVDLNSLTLTSDIYAERERIQRDWTQRSKKTAEPQKDELSSSHPIIDSNRIEALKRYQMLTARAPWRIMNDEKLAALFMTTFRASPQLSPEQMQSNILEQYQGLFNFDPVYNRQRPVPKLKFHDEKIE